MWSWPELLLGYQAMYNMLYIMLDENDTIEWPLLLWLGTIEATGFILNYLYAPRSKMWLPHLLEEHHTMAEPLKKRIRSPSLEVFIG